MNIVISGIAEQEAQLILENIYPNISIKDLPIDVLKIAEKLGLKVRPYNPYNNDISGQYNRKKKLIQYSENDFEYK